MKKLTKIDRQKQRQRPSESVRNRCKEKVAFLTLSDAILGFVRNSMALYFMYNKQLERLADLSETSDAFLGVLRIEQ